MSQPETPPDADIPSSDPILHEPYRLEITVSSIDAGVTPADLAEAPKEYAQSIVATVRQPLVVLDSELRVRSVNRAFCETFEVEPGDAEGRFIFELGDGQWNIAELRTLLQSIIPTNSSFNAFEVEHDFERIGRKTMLINARRFPPGGNYDLLLLAIEDITERRRAEDRFRALLESAPDAMVIADHSGAIVLVNAQTEKLFGYGRQELLGQPVEALVPQRFRDDHARHRAAYVTAPQIREMGAGRELYALRKDGSEFPVEISLSPLETGSGLITSSSIRDITDRKRMAAAVAASEVRYRRLFEAAMDGILILDPDTRKITDANPFMVDLLGYPREELIGKELWEIGLLKDEEARRVAFLELKAHGYIRYEDLPLESKRGGRREVEFVSNLYAENGHEVIQCNIRDITERKRLEDELRRRAGQLAEADRRKDEFIAVLAHELRNPLNSIGMAARLARQPDAKRREWGLGVIDHQIQNLSRLVDDLLDVSRISTGKIHLRHEPVDLSLVIGQAVDSVREHIAEREHGLEVSTPPGPMMIEGDSTRLEQVFVNLLTNAAKYTERGGRIALTAQTAADHYIVRVRDNGEGIPAAMLPHLFEMFIQVDSSGHRSRGGLGIGLSLVKDLVEMHGGTVHAASEGAGRGSEFTVRLPAAGISAAPGAHLPAPDRTFSRPT